MATTTICSAVLSTMMVPALVATVAAMLPAAAEAQDYTSGSLTGTVTDASGAPVSGAAVTLTSKAQGQSFNLTTNANGQFTASGLAPGDYTVAVTASGYSDFSGTAQIVISQDTRFTYALTSAGGEATQVVVKGRRVRQDFAKTTTGLTVDLDTLVSQQPIARNLTAVTMLAPTVTKGQTGNGGFEKAASFGGGSVAENAYYIDGLNITNPDTYVGSNQVPFDFYKTIEVKTGGYQAEFGRATGGVVNATSKPGTNQFMFAVHGNYEPADLESEQVNSYAYIGKFTHAQTKALSVEAGGPLIKDHLFAYGLYQMNDSYSTSANRVTGVFTKLKDSHPFLGGKLDGYITPTQHLSLTYFDTSHTERGDVYDFDGTAIGDKEAPTAETLGGQNWVANYNGKVTEWLSVSAAYGDTKDADDFVPSNTTDYNVASYYGTDGVYTGASQTISSNQSSLGIGIDDVERKFYRFDGDMRFDAFGHHHVRFGYDHEKNSMAKISTLVGIQPVSYSYELAPEDDADSANPNDEVLHVIYELLGGNVTAENSAYYVEDSWDVTPNLNLQIGLRNDDFTQNNLSGERYLNLTGNMAPRLGFSWDPAGDGTWKVYGSYGSNFIPPAMNLGYRGKDLYYEELFNAPAGGWDVDPTTGLPTAVGTPHPNADNGYSTPCPTSNIASAPGLSSVVAGVAACNVHGNGSQEGASAKTQIGLKATEEDEEILGVTFRANDMWTFGVSAINRDLKRVSEDSDFQTAIIKYLDANGLDSSDYTDGTITNSYYVWNVGDHGVTVNLKNALPGETSARTITLTADQLGHYHDPKRNYKALVFDFKRAFDGKWGLQGSYTWSRSYGNYEGTVKSEVGNSQQDDAGATIAFDAPGFEDYGTGLLPNDRTHTLKLWGSYAINDSFLIGANVLVQSPAHFSCLGFHPVGDPSSPTYDGDSYAASYGPYSHYCNGVGSAQGKGLKSDWTKNLDLSLRYTVPKTYSVGGKLVLRADIFNVFDTHQILQRRLTYETTGVGHISANYGKPTYYNTPRYVRLGFDLSY